MEIAPTADNLLFFSLLVLPGFISLKVHRLLKPGERVQLKDDILDALAYGLGNAILLAWTVPIIIGCGGVLVHGGTLTFNFASHSLYLYAVIVLFLMPIFWPVLIEFLLRWGEKHLPIVGRAKSASDEYFTKKEDCWIIIHLTDGRLVGGYFGPNSVATVYPNSGHLYVEELWKLDDDGVFLEVIEQSKGAIFRPDDYHFVEFFDADGVIEG